MVKKDKIDKLKSEGRTDNRYKKKIFKALADSIFYLKFINSEWYSKDTTFSKEDKKTIDDVKRAVRKAAARIYKLGKRRR